MKKFTVDQKIQQVVQYYEKLIANMPGNVYWLDSNGVTLGCNQNVLDMFGLKSFDQFKGLSFEEMGQICHWSERATQSFKADTLEVARTSIGKFNIDEPLISDSKGQLLHFLTSRVPIFDSNNKIISVIGISIDITERKKLEENLIVAKEKAEAANQAKTAFLENMRHDIRTPVGGIVGCAQLIQSQAGDVAKVTEFATDLVESSDALLEFLNKVLESIKVASGEIPLLKKKFDLRKTLEQIIHLNKSYAISKNLELNLEYDESIPKYVIGGSIRIQRIILELVTNALKFTEKGQVRVTARLRKNEAKAIIVELSVSDTGIGIPEDKQHEVYTRFRRLTPSSQGIYSGTGLGLSVVKQFMGDLGGELSLKSEPQQGSTFTCLIPLQEPLLMGSEDVEEVPIESKNKRSKKAVVGNEPPTALSNSSGGRVLVVEDQRIAAKIAQHVLTKLHYQVDVAESGKMALALIKKHHYDLILMDIGLPDNDGGEVTRRIRLQQWKRNPSVPIVGLTAHIDAENKHRCIDAGINAVYTKPLTAEKAVEIVSAFIPCHPKTPFLGTNTKRKSFKELPVLDIDRAI